jgi:hypothetical protein
MKISEEKECRNEFLTFWLFVAVNNLEFSSSEAVLAFLG